MSTILYSLILLIMLCSNLYAGSSLTINTPKKQIIYTRENLLNHPKVVTLKSIHLPSYPDKIFDLKAIKLCELLVADDSTGTTLKVRAFDNYISYFNLQKIHPCETPRASIAYLAIEEPNEPWPIIPQLKRSAGSFYLIWIGQKVPQSNWIFGVESIQVTASNPFSKLLPQHSTDVQAKGLEIFADQCGGCHSINLVGNLEIGPDLNFPKNPTEYFSEKHLRQFIRNPQSIRYMKNDKMFPFTKQNLSDEELDALIEFLKLMREHKIKEVPAHLQTKPLL
ncbi:putative signal peptide protein [Legionella lansingensis]|uniref:Putative signal peptide protein n=1 Tax=Legionella lansingensis TaxID=45067 RepID=A0A0W0VKE7_9GAMM|nr:cytochrome c [Legionella lansingensis]KTD20556.1 putative signal peptide protein [Legionella lansingensis]SNV47746.1 putative signal peptide protein [Legionella lansingensis]